MTPFGYEVSLGVYNNSGRLGEEVGVCVISLGRVS